MYEMTMPVPQLHVGAGHHADGVTVFPVWTDHPGTRGVDTAGAARVSVAERAGAGVVGELVVTNTGPRPALLLDGELLEGGLQNRALVRDLILAPGQSEVVEVACVEQGRWDGGGDHARLARRASASVRRALQHEGDRQRQVWNRVARHGTRLGPSATGALTDHLDRVAVTPGQIRTPVLPGQRGVVLGVGGRPLVLELFGSTKDLVAHLPALLAGARLDAASVPPQHDLPVPGYRARDMAAYLGRAHLDLTAAPPGMGLSVNARTTHAEVRGVALNPGTLAHLSVLNTRHPVLEATCV